MRLTENQNYVQAVRTLAKPGQEIADEVTNEQWDMLSVCSRLGRFSQSIYNITLGHLPKLNNPLRHEGGLLRKYAYDIHLAGALNGECGEIYDAIKRHVIYRIPLDAPQKKLDGKTLRENLNEEFGDVIFYMTGLRDGDGMKDLQVLQALTDFEYFLFEIAKKVDIDLEKSREDNLSKLIDRYGSDLCYSNEAAEARADKS